MQSTAGHKLIGISFFKTNFTTASMSVSMNGSSASFCSGVQVCLQPSYLVVIIRCHIVHIVHCTEVSIGCINIARRSTSSHPPFCMCLHFCTSVFEHLVSRTLQRMYASHMPSWHNAARLIHSWTLTTSSVFGVSPWDWIFRSHGIFDARCFINVYDSSQTHFEQECFMVTAYINHIHTALNEVTK
jgi:hypothetical protein